LFWKTKQKDSGYKFYRTINDNILVKKSEELASPIINIKTEKDLQQLMK